MDKPTSAKDVIKSLPPLTVDQKYQKAFQRPPVSVMEVKPVFDKMLAALKFQEELILEVRKRYEIEREQKTENAVHWLKSWLIFSKFS